MLGPANVFLMVVAGKFANDEIREPGNQAEINIKAPAAYNPYWLALT